MSILKHLNLKYWILITTAIFFCCQPLFSQKSQKIDSLLKLLETQLSDKDKVDTYIMLCEIHKVTDKNKIAKYAYPALSLAKEIGYQEGMADAYYMLSATHIYSGDFEEVLLLLDSTIQIAESIQYRPGMARAYRGYGWLSEKRGDYQESLSNYSRALEFSQSINDFAMVAQILNSISVVYIKKGDATKGIEYLNESLKVCEKHDLLLESITPLTSKGTLYMGQGDYPTALSWLDSARVMSIELGSFEDLGSIYTYTGECYSFQGDYVNALKYYQMALDQEISLNQLSRTPDIYRKMAMTQYYMGNTDKSLAYFNKDLEMNLQFGFLADVVLSYNNLGYAYLLLGKYDQALSYLDKGLAVGTESEYKNSYASLYNSYAELYLELKNYRKAIYYLEKSLKLAREISNQFEIAYQLTALSKYHYEVGQYDKALLTANEAIDIASAIGAVPTLSQAYEIKAKILAATGRGMEAYETHVAHKKFADSLFNADKTKAFTRIEADYEFQLEKDSIRFAQEKETLALSAEIDKGAARQQASMLGLAALGLLLAVISLFFYQNRKKNKVLTSLNREVQTQNAEIKAQRDHLEDLNKTKSKFFSIISHDLRSPMSSFQALSDVIEYNLKEKNYEELKEVNQEVVKRSKEITLLLDNLLAWAVSEEGEFPFNPQSTSLKETVSQVKDLYAPVAQYKNINIIDETEDLYVFTDPNAFNTIMRNLVSNAIKFTSVGGEVKLMSHIREGMIEIEISDNGVGMTKAEVDLLNEGAASSKGGTAGEKGVGLGMKLVKEFIGLSGGEFSIKSTKGEGTQFLIFMPTKYEELVEA